MGSITNYSTLRRFEKAFSQQLIEHFSYLKSQTVTSVFDTEVEHWVSADIELSNGDVFEVHYRWATEKETSVNEEILEDGDFTMNEWLTKYVKGQVVKDIYVGGADRDDEAYLFLKLENDVIVDCRIGFETESCEIFGLAREVLNDNEIEAFYKGGV